MSIDKDAFVFLISHTVHQLQIDNPAELTTLSVTTFAESLGANIDNQSPWKIKKNEGQKATFKSVEQGIIGEYRVIIIGQIQYQVVVVTSGDSLDNEMIHNFSKSVKIKG